VINIFPEYFETLPHIVKGAKRRRLKLELARGAATRLRLL
jgi:hypothetical protein